MTFINFPLLPGTCHRIVYESKSVLFQKEKKTWVILYFRWHSLGVCDLIWVSRTSHLIRHICVLVSIFAFEINHPFIWHALHLFISYSFFPVFILNYQSLILAILKSCRVCSWLISISFIFINDGNEALWTNQDEKKNLMEITSIFLDISNLLKKIFAKF